MDTSYWVTDEPKREPKKEPVKSSLPPAIAESQPKLASLAKNESQQKKEAESKKELQSRINQPKEALPVVSTGRKGPTTRGSTARKEQLPVKKTSPVAEPKPPTPVKVESQAVKEKPVIKVVNASYWVTADEDEKFLAQKSNNSSGSEFKVVNDSSKVPSSRDHHASLSNPKESVKEVHAPKSPSKQTSDQKESHVLKPHSKPGLDPKEVHVPKPHLKPCLDPKEVHLPKPHLKPNLDPKEAHISKSTLKPNLDPREIHVSKSHPKPSLDSKSNKTEVKKIETKGSVVSSSVDLGDKFDKFQYSYESDHEWNLRKAFILAHHEKYPENRLICLSNCFINSEVYGASYPAAVMNELADLKKDLGGIIKELESRARSKREAKEIKFVKASGSGAVSKEGVHHRYPSGQHHHDAAHQRKKEELPKLGSFEAALLAIPPATVSSVSHKRKSTELEHPNSRPKMMAFVKSGSEYKSTENVTRLAPAVHEKSGGYKAAMKNFEMAIGKHALQGSIEERFVKLGEKIREESQKDVKRKNSIEYLVVVLSRQKMTETCEYSIISVGYQCELFIDSILVSTGKGTSKKTAKHNAFDLAVSNLKKPHLQIVSVNPEKKELITSDEPFGAEPEAVSAETPAVLTKCGLQEVAARGMKRLHPEASPLQNFMIIERADLNQGVEANAAVILRQSADFSKMKLMFEFREYNGKEWCRVLLEHEVLSDEHGPTGKDAKNVASEKALERLRHCCWTIKMKQTADTDESGLSREEVLGEITKSEEKIDSGIGNKLLKMMGWKGGGIGKSGTGIAEPVKADQSAINRQGLGLSSEKGITQNFVKCIRDVISDYAKSNRQDDLAFAPSFTSEERAVIHRECHKFGLKTRSHGAGDDRHLVASRRRTASELFTHIMDCGGATSKYELCPPFDYKYVDVEPH